MIKTEKEPTMKTVIFHSAKEKVTIFLCLEYRFLQQNTGSLNAQSLPVEHNFENVFQN